MPPSTQTGEGRRREQLAPKYGPETVARAKALRDEGVKWETIAKKLGVGADGLRRRLDPAYRAKRNQQNAVVRTQRSLGLRNMYRTAHLPADEMARILATVPVDTRGRMARVMGDPLPGRSALDQKRAQH
jgi:hypothetical protein